MSKEINNREYAKQDFFVNLCAECTSSGRKVEATKRQASKFRNGKGTAYLFSLKK